MLLVESNFKDVGVIAEATQTGKDWYIEGPFAQADVVNRNRRRYPLHIMEREMGRYAAELVKNNRAVGELTHPETPEINLDKISHLIVQMEQQGNNFIGRAKILNTPAGNIARGLLEGGVGLGVSTRATGSVQRDSQGIAVVQEDLKMMAVDIVWQPSAPDAFVEGLMENASFVWDSINEDVEFVQQLQEEMKRKKSRELQEAKIQTFQKFLNHIKGK